MILEFRSMTPFKVNHIPVRMRATIKTSQGETVLIEPTGQTVHKYHPPNMMQYGDYVGVLGCYLIHGNEETSIPTKPFPYTRKGILQAIKTATGREFKDFTFNELNWIENEL